MVRTNFLLIHGPGFVAQELIPPSVNPDSRGPLEEYDDRVHSRQLRDDEHQRGTITCHRLSAYSR